MTKKTKIILIIVLSTILLLASEDGAINLNSINTGQTSDSVVVELEFSDTVKKYTTNTQGNNIIVDIVDSNLKMPDVPIQVQVDNLNIIQPMQLKKSPPVTRVILVKNNQAEYTSLSRGNKIIINFLKETDNSERMEKTLEQELGLKDTSENDITNYWDGSSTEVKTNEASEEVTSSKQPVSPKNRTDDDTISFNFSGMSLREIFETLSNLTGKNIIVDGDVKDREINLFIQNLPVDEALNLVITSTGLSMNNFNHNTFIISEKERAQEIHVMRRQKVFRLTNSSAQEVISLISSNNRLKEIIDTSNLSVDTRINAILAYDTEENLKLLGEIIEDIDKKEGQVTIELHLVEMNRTDLNNFGFDIEDFPLTPMNMDILNLPSDVSIYGQLEALASEERANILSSPKIRVVHGRKADFEIGDEIPVPYYSYQEAHKFVHESGKDLRVVEPLKNFTKANVGIKLEVEPYIHDNNEVSLDLDISVSDLIKIDDEGQPYTSNRNTTTHVRLKDKETAVLGGLIKQEEKKSDRRVPGLQNIPILRSIFRSRKTEQTNQEMLMFITPHFVNRDDEPDNIGVTKPGEGKKDNFSQNEKKSSDEYYDVIGEIKQISK
ncbi:MAG: hypothetical protein ACQESP_06515 [Candidatus Muiribacteriota bacterium]